MAKEKILKKLKMLKELIEISLRSHQDGEAPDLISVSARAELYLKRGDLKKLKKVEMEIDEVLKKIKH